MYKCYLPWRGEFGWMIMCFVKKFHADPSTQKIICCKQGHECLFPTAVASFHNFQDIPDGYKAGVAEVYDEGWITQRVKDWMPNQPMEFVPLSECGWHNKHDFANYTFIPESKHKFGLKTDVVITPRNRTIDPIRNWTQRNWQTVVDILVSNGITVGVCGARDTSFHLRNVTYKSYDYIDVDSDIEMMNNAKLVVTQESGMQYLSFLCQRPTFCIDHYHRDFGSDLHRNPNVPFENPTHVWEDPPLLADEVISFLKDPK